MLDALGGAPLFHLAGHGVLEPDHPWDAHLRLAADETIVLADLIARAPQIGVAVLSGCETGVPQALSRDERIGLPDALLAAGGRAVLAADRLLPDADAAQLIRVFYAHGGATEPAEALRAARVEMRARGDEAWRGWRVTGRRIKKM